MPTNYPSSIDSFVNPTAADLLSSPSHAFQHRNVNDALVAVQTVLGTNPQGAAATVSDRIASAAAAFTAAGGSLSGTYPNPGIASEAVGADQRELVGSAGVYGAAANIPIVTVDTAGRVTGISLAPIAGGGGGTGAPLGASYFVQLLDGVLSAERALSGVAGEVVLDLTSPGQAVAYLATVLPSGDMASIANPYGSSTLIPVINVDDKGRITYITTASTGTAPAPIDAEYFVTSANASLTNEKVLGSSSSVVLNTATPGAASLGLATVLDGSSPQLTPGLYGDATHVVVMTVDATGRVTSISQELADVSGGGGGPEILTNEIAGGAANELLYQIATDDTGFLPAGSAGEVLRSRSTTQPPSWVSLNLSDNTAAVTGTLPFNRGGTGFNSYTTGDTLFFNDTGSLSKLPIAAAGNVLLTRSIGDLALLPFWLKAQINTSAPLSDITGVLRTGRGGTGVSSLGATPAGKLLIGKSDSTFAVANVTPGLGVLATAGSGSLTFAADFYTFADGESPVGKAAYGSDPRFHNPLSLGASVSSVLSLSTQALGAVNQPADRIVFWNDGAASLQPLTTGTLLSISDTTLNKTEESGAGTVTSVALDLQSTGLFLVDPVSPIGGTTTSRTISSSGVFEFAGASKLAIANGGTGQSTKQAAFNTLATLSPAPAKGSLITRGDPSAGAFRLPVGSNGTHLCFASTDPPGVGTPSEVGWRKLIFSPSFSQVTNILRVVNGGTGINSVAKGALLYKTSTTIGALAPVAVGSVLKSAGSSAPNWGQVYLGPAPGITVQGELSPANGGTSQTGSTSAGQLLIGNGTSFVKNTLSSNKSIKVVSGLASPGVGSVSISSETKLRFKTADSTVSTLAVDSSLEVTGLNSNSAYKFSFFLTFVQSNLNVIITEISMSLAGGSLKFFDARSVGEGSSGPFNTVAVSSGDNLTIVAGARNLMTVMVSGCLFTSTSNLFLRPSFSATGYYDEGSSTTIVTLKSGSCVKVSACE